VLGGLTKHKHQLTLALKPVFNKDCGCIPARLLISCTSSTLHIKLHYILPHHVQLFLTQFLQTQLHHYTTWVGEMEAWLHSSDLWHLVSGKSAKPTLSTPLITSTMDKLEEWEIKADIVAGWIYLMVESNQRIHLTNIHDDPIKMWKAPESIYFQKCPACTTQTKDTLPDPKEFSGHASPHSVDPSDPHTPLQLDADFDWNADTGATSHMTPHRHWI
jgi:hypothetical protein